MTRFRVQSFFAAIFVCASMMMSTAATQAVLLQDDYTGAGNPDTNNVNFNLANRQSGSIAPVTSVKVGNTQIGNGTLGLGGNYQLLAFTGTVSPQQNFNNARSEGGMRISFDVNPDNNVNSDQWTAVNLGMAQADRHLFINNNLEHFGVLFRADGRIQAFDGATAVNSTAIWAPGGNRGGSGDFNNVHLEITDPTDDNPFDGVGQTDIAIFSSLVNGGTTSIFNFSKGGGGYSENFVHVTSLDIGGVDNLVIDGSDKIVQIPGLFNTGVDDSGNVLPNSPNSRDTHYAITVNANGGAPFQPFLQDETVFPIAGPWIDNSAESKWIAPEFNTSGSAGGAGVLGNYEYELVFDLDGLDPTTAQVSGLWASDNAGLDILINGVSTGHTNNQFGSLSAFFIEDGFVDGENTLTFVLNNASAGFTGLRVEGLTGSAAPSVPEPATGLLVLLGVAATVRRRRAA